MNKPELSWLQRRHNAKAAKLLATLEENIRERQANGEEITEIVLPKSMEKKLSVYEMVPIDEAIAEAEAKLAELEEEQKWRNFL